MGIDCLADCALFADTQEVGYALRYVMKCADYFHLGNRSVFPITRLTGSTVQIGQKYRRVESSCCTSAMKIASYIVSLGLMPLVAGISVGVGRCYYRIKVDRNELIKDTAEHIQKTVTRSPGTSRIRNSADRILGELYLGDGQEFLDCTGMSIFTVDSGGNYGSLRNTDNPHLYKQIVTLCPLEALTAHVPVMQKTNVYNQMRMLEKNFAAAKIHWLYLGKTILDIQDGDHPDLADLKWAALVHDCSVESELTEFSLEDGKSEDIDANRSAKADALTRLKPQKMFERVFPVLDRAVFENEKTLVHCMQGMSRSVSVVVAYIIKTFDISPDVATKFVQMLRPCASPRFSQHLKKYHQQLKAPPPLLEEKWALTKEEQALQVV